MNPLRALLDVIERGRLRRIAKRRLDAMLLHRAVTIYARRRGDAGIAFARRRAIATYRTGRLPDGGMPIRVRRGGHAVGVKTLRGTVVVAGILGSAVAAWPLGDVQVLATDGELSVMGDDNPNQIEISVGADAGAFVVTGVDGTAINGGASAAVTGVRTIRIDMKAGQDSVELQDVEVDGGLRVKLGRDRDTFVFEGGRVGGNLQVNGGGKAGDDLKVQGARIGGRLALATGNKSDTITVRNVAIGGGLDIRPGGGNDYVLVQHTAVDSAARTDIDMGGGNDRLELVDVDFEDDMDVELGDGDDEVRVEDCDFDGEIEADGGDGDDELHLSGDNGFDLGEDRSVEDFESFD